MGETVIVTDGTDSFYGSRTIFTTLKEVGGFDRIKSFGSSIADAKKMLLSRQARYTGLTDMLEFTEGEFSEAAADATCWLAVNVDEATLPAQVAAAQAAGIKRVFALISADGPTAALADPEAIKAAFASSGMTYTITRTGSLVATGGGGGLRVGEVDEPTCEDLPKDDTYRFVCEALSIPESYDRLFSLCPSADASQLREMRMAGCTRREETEALLKGQIKEKTAEELASPEVAAAKVEEDTKSDAEKEAEREDELKMLLEKARVKGIEKQKAMAEEEAIKAAARAERQAYFAQLAEQAEEESKDDESKDDDDEPPPPPPPPPEDKKDDGDGGDDRPLEPA